MIESITSQFEAGRSSLPGGPALDAVRREALEKFTELGLPGRRVESWHYTNLDALADRDLRFAVPEPAAGVIKQAERVLTELGLDDDMPRCVFVDGHRIDALTLAGTGSAFEITGANQSAAEILGHEAGELALDALNKAFSSQGACIRVGTVEPEPLRLVFLGSGKAIAPQIRIRVELSAGSRAVIEQYFVDLPEAAESWLNLVMEIEQGSGSDLSVNRLQLHGPSQYQTTLCRVHLAAGARFAAGSVELGGQLVRNEHQIALAGEEAQADIFGLTLCRERQHLDTRIAADHRAAHTISRQFHRSIASDRSRSVFNGKVTVRKDAQHIDARQRNDNLLLSPTAEIDTKPELEIYADQVVCSHGATVGELDEDQLFYLRARGIDSDIARSILTTAFANVVLERFAGEAFRERARKAVDSKLPQSAPTV